MSTDSQSFEFKSARDGKASGKDGATHEIRTAKGLVKKVPLVLPPDAAIRWGARSKAAVVAAVRSEMITLEEACARYALSVAEYFTWERGLDTFGIEGLGLTVRQKLRRNQTDPEK